MTVWCGGGEAGSRLWQGGVAHVAQQSLLLINFFCCHLKRNLCRLPYVPVVPHKAVAEVSMAEQKH